MAGVCAAPLVLWRVTGPHRSEPAGHLGEISLRDRASQKLSGPRKERSQRNIVSPTTTTTTRTLPSLPPPRPDPSGKDPAHSPEALGLDPGRPAATPLLVSLPP